MRRFTPLPLVLTAVLSTLVLAAPAGADAVPTAVSSAPQLVTGPAVAPLTATSYRNDVLHLSVSQPGRLELHYLRIDHLAHVVENETVAASPGDNALALRRWMRPGRYRITVLALDAAGTASRPLHLQLRVHH